MRIFISDPHDLMSCGQDDLIKKVSDEVDSLRCELPVICGKPNRIGWWTDVNDKGWNIGGFSGFAAMRGESTEEWVVVCEGCDGWLEEMYQKGNEA